MDKKSHFILDEKSLPENPLHLFEAWFTQATKSEVNDPNAMGLATCTPDGKPSLRTVLLKHYDEAGFVFYTNLQSRKGQEILANPHAALCFHWKTLECQVRIEGSFVPVSAEEADDYYNSRPRGSRIGAWASVQSTKLDCRETLEKRVADYEQKFAEQDKIPRPPHWSGFRLVPEAIEFWSAGDYRLHDRFIYRRVQSGKWRIERLYP